ncbi:hypothetical protein FSB73_03300 [Arachidicoccus ginsenosidivorans]|uniref:SMP-30/Gluconolactonase/LRE-like region domain-containing protein n=1 Tax=Arachidicoccus ginsenosidivorans TaxID=496057 RepID=A0A5B8VKR3_9BACT|nr:NHL repeat-containing protein [Arachidicoccus ginsenosidivorans]QEC70848.1 hypothetical protein FSB73_03300 [Arachidicoccus ginsenosidivorans]
MKKFLLSTLLLTAAYLLKAQTSTLFATGFDHPYGLAFDASGILYVSNTNGNSVSKVDVSGAVTETYTGFIKPVGLAFEGEGNLYVATPSNNTVSKVNPSGTVTATYTGFNFPIGLAFDASGYLYVANEVTDIVNKLDAGGNIVATYTGFNRPVALSLDALGNLFVANYLGNTVNKVDVSGHITATYSGFKSPTGICLDGSGNLFIANYGDNSISMIPHGSVDGTPATAFMSGLPYAPSMLTYRANTLYVADGTASVYKITGGILQTRFYVKQDATGANNGQSWADAYTDLQAAINAAHSGDSLFVAATATPYQPASGTGFSMKEGVKIFGGFLGSETDFSQRNLASKPTLQGNGNSVITNINNGLTAAAVLDGFIITGGYANTSINGGHGGGGIYNLFVSPTYSHLVISGNRCNNVGAGSVLSMDHLYWTMSLLRIIQQQMAVEALTILMLLLL